jgi:hypothetical protein
MWLINHLLNLLTGMHIQVEVPSDLVSSTYVLAKLRIQAASRLHPYNCRATSAYQLLHQVTSSTRVPRSSAVLVLLVLSKLSCNCAWHCHILEKTWLQGWLMYENIWKYMKIYENIGKYRKIYENIWKYMKIYENIWKYMKIYENIWKYMKISTSSTSEKLWIVTKNCASVSKLMGKHGHKHRRVLS